MVNLSEEGQKKLEEGISTADGFQRDLIIVLRKIEHDLHYAEENRERQTKEIIEALQNIRSGIDEHGIRTA